MSGVRQYDPYAAQLGYLSESIHRHLTERECGIFDRGLADYHRRRNIKAFVECLSLVLNTNQKRQLLIPIRDTYVKPSDMGKFNQLVQAHGLATSFKKKKREEEKSKTSDGIHKVEVKRDSNGEWGFNIRGGADQGTGVYISWVEPESNAHKSGLHVGDQILKANETSFENISHYEAVQLIRSFRKLRLWVLSHGRVPSTRMAHKVYRWIDSEGRPTTPPPDPFDIMEQKARGEFRVTSDADERKVTIMVESGKELGISIRGGSEHGLGVYVSKVEEGSVAEAYGVKIGDQILEVNGISFFNIVHADAARALRAQPCMVMKLKDVGKLPHSRITTYGQTEWHQSHPAKERKVKRPAPPKPAFQKGAGTQVMLRKQETGVHGRGMMNEVARSVLSPQEFSTFTYYINQYEQYGISVDDLATALLDLLDTAEKLQLISEIRGVIRATDVDQFNELTVHQEIAARKARKKTGNGSAEGSLTALAGKEGSGLPPKQPKNAQQTVAQVHHEDPQALQTYHSPPAAADLSFSSGNRTLTPEDDVDSGGRDQVPQRMSPVLRKPVTGIPMFHAPPPPSSTAPSTSTPEGGSQTKASLASGLKDRRQRMRPGAREESSMEEEEPWDSHYTDPTLSSIRTPPTTGGRQDVASPSLQEVEARIQQELEAKLRQEFEEKERRLFEEHERKLEQEKQQKEEQLRKEREALEQQIHQVEERTKMEIEGRVRREAEQEMRRQLEEKEKTIEEKMERFRAEQQELEALQQHSNEVGEQSKMELEEKIWKEAEESLRQEFESQVQQERETLQQKSEEERMQVLKVAEHRIQEQLEKKYKQQYEEKLRSERRKLQEREEEERRKKDEEERRKQEEEVAKMEAEEQARIELEEKIRKDTEAAVRAEYEARLQFETEQRARLAEEVKAHKAAEERMERERMERERERETMERERGRERKRMEQEREREQQQRRQREEQERRQREEQEREEREREERERRERERREREEQDQRAREQQEREETERRERQQAQRKEREDTQRRRMEEQQRLARERQQREREEEEQRRQKQQQEKRPMRTQQHGEEEEEAEKLLKLQRQQLQQQEQEEEEERLRKEEEEQQAQELARNRKKAEAERKKELQRKREENIRRREEEQRRKDEEVRLRIEGQKRQQQEEEQRKRQQEVEKARNGKKKGFGVQHVAVKFGDEDDSAVTQRQEARKEVKNRQHLVEEERKRAEEKLQKRMERLRAQRAKEQSEGHLETDSGQPTQAPQPPTTPGKSFAGYTDLHGEILTITVTKVNKKLGIAIDGGANTKQKAVIIREISAEGCAFQTAKQLRVGQQLLQVDGVSLHGLKHKDTVMAIKSAFEGPLNKTIEFVVLDPEATPAATEQPSVKPEAKNSGTGFDNFIAQASFERPLPPQSAEDTGKSFAGYTDLQGEILTIPVTKVNKKLGIAIDGGANTKQQAITVRQITPDGSAALSGKGLKVGQQILQVNDTSLNGLVHADVVAAIKSAFDGPINTTIITFIVLDPQ